MIILIFLVLIILNIITLYIIINKFFCKEKVCGKKSLWSIIAKIFSVILNLALAYVVFWGVILGLLFISPFGWFGGVRDRLWVSDFATGLLLCEVSVFVPYGLNVLLYRLWYKKFGLSKWWTFPAILIGAGAFIGYVFLVLSENFINGWAKAEWIWR